MLASLLATTNAYAMFDAQLLVGQRSGEIASESVDSQEIGAAAHVAFIPLVPVAFGLYANSIKFTGGETMKDAKGLEAGLQAYAWFPIGIAGLKPYAKVGLPVYSAITSTFSAEGAQSAELVWETSGMHINFGARYSIVPFVGVIFEVGLGQQKIKPAEVELLGQKVDVGSIAGLEEEDYKSTAYSIGVEVGL